MVYKIALLPGAEEDVDIAYEWYENQQAGLGERFLEELVYYYSKLEGNPLIFSNVGNGFRQAVMHRFPYILVYKIIKEEIIIYAVFHVRRNPKEKFRME